MKKLSRKRKHYSLYNIIFDDLLKNLQLPIFLFICAIITAISIIHITYSTRILTEKYEQLMLEHNVLDAEWRNLILEENALSDHSRIERIAIEKLQMQYIDPSQENIVIQK